MPVIKNNGKGLFLVSGSKTPVVDVVDVSTNNSNIRQEGYVVIVGVHSSLKKEKHIQRVFNKNQIMA